MPPKKQRNKHIETIRRNLNNKYRKRVNRIRDEREQLITIDKVKKTRDMNAKNVKELLNEIKTNMKELSNKDDKTLDILTKCRDQITFLHEKNKKLSSDIVEKSNRIKTLYQTNRNLWTDVIDSVSCFYDETQEENTEPRNKSNTLKENNNPYTTFNFLHMELIQ